MEELVLQRLVIVDTEGRPRIELGTTEYGSPVINLFGADGQPHMTLTVDGDEHQRISMISLDGWSGGPDIRVMVHSDDGPAVVVEGKEGKELFRTP